MSGGRLVILDRLGRDKRAYLLEDGLATIGSDNFCDIKVVLPQVSPHHATVEVHTNQTVVRSVAGSTLVNGELVSVAALRHRDILSIGGRSLRWEYSVARPRPLAPQPALVRREPRPRPRRRGSEPASRAVLVPASRASMPASSGGKQVAIVQPQRRDTSEQNDVSRSNSNSSTERTPRRNDEQVSGNDGDSSTRQQTPLCDTVASQWIESRRTPLRLTALRAAHRRRHAASSHPPHPSHPSPPRKIRAPDHIDHTKQAAIMLMTGHTPKSKQSPKQPSFVVTKPSPVRKTPKQKKSSPRKSPKSHNVSQKSQNVSPRSPNVSLKSPNVKKSRTPHVTPKRASTFAATRSSARGSGDHSASILEITDSDSRTLRASNSSARSARKSTLRSPVSPTPKKSALKDPSAKKSTRKIESIKFDLSNLESSAQERSSDVLFVTETTKDNSFSSASGDEMSLHYSDTSTNQSPSPRKPIHSRSSRMLEKSLGSTFTPNTPSMVDDSTLTSESPRSKKSLRGSLIVQKALEKSDVESSRYSRRTTKSLSDQSYNTTVASARKTKTLSPRSSNQNLESYSIVDLVSIDSNESARSVYNSAASNNTTVTFGTPQTAASRATRSNNPSLLCSSTPFLNRTSSPKAKNENRNSKRVSNISTRRSASLTTPKNSTKHTPFNSTRISRVSRSRSRINDSDILLMDNEDDDASPKSSRRSKSGLSSSVVRKNISIMASPTQSPLNGTVTPPNRHSPEEATTPVLSIQSLLDQSALSQSSSTSRHSQTRAKSASLKRKTIGANVSQPKKVRTSIKSKSFNLSSRRSMRARKTSSDSIVARSQILNNRVETPRSAVELVQEGVKNKHSTAKKPISKRHIIDNLDESDFVKQLFNSPVKRKLSQSMTEFSKKHLFDDDVPSRPTRKTTALTGRTPDNSVLNESNAFTPELFVSPLSTPGNSPNLSGVKRLFAKKTPENDLRNVKGVKALLRTPRTRKSVQNDLSEVSGVKRVFARSPKNRLSDVRVKEVFASSPKNDLRRVSGVKSLFQSTRKPRSPKNTLEDVRGVKKLFQNSPANDLRRVSGVKRTLRVHSPRNDLTDVRGVKQLYRNEIRNNLSDLSGVEELFHEPQDLDTTFDQLMGKPRVRSYTKSKSMVNIIKKSKQTRKAHSLHNSIGLITNNVEEWLENELRKRVHKPEEPARSSNVLRELQKLATDTVEGVSPTRATRIRNSTLTKSVVPEERQKSPSEVYSAHTLPLKKRSLPDGGGSGSGGGGSAGEVRLPIKKRAVLHSTPMKGAGYVTLNASELGRVSPIVGERTTQLTKESPKKLSKARAPKTKVIAIVEELPKPSPRRTRAKIQSSPQRVRATRNRKTKDAPATNAKKRRSSIVITKKPPVMTPKSDPKTAKPKPVQEKATEIAPIKSPMKSRSLRQKSQLIEKVTPKKTRAKANPKNVAISKSSPKPKPRSTRQAKNISEPAVTSSVVKQTRRGKKTVNNKTVENETEESKPEKAKRARKTTNVSESKSEVRRAEVEAEAPVRRTRKTVQVINEGDKSQNKRSKGPKDKVVEQVNVEPEPVRPTRARKTKENTVIPETNKRQKKTTVVDDPKPAVDNIEVAPRTSRRGRVKENVETVVTSNKRNASEVKESVKDKALPKRSARAKENMEVETVNKIGESNESDNKRGRRGRNVSNKEVETVQEVGRRNTRTIIKQNTEAKPVRGKKVTVAEEIPKPTARKRKAKTEETAVEEETAGKRRRVTRVAVRTEVVQNASSRSRRR